MMCVHTSHRSLSQNEHNAARNAEQEHSHYARLMSAGKANYMCKSTLSEMHRISIQLECSSLRRVQINIHLLHILNYMKRVIIIAPPYRDRYYRGGNVCM